MKLITRPIARLASLNNRKKNLNKEWYVDYGYRNPQTQRMQTFRVIKDLNSKKSYVSRMRAGQRLVDQINEQLKNGYNPFEDSRYLYEDNIHYKHSSDKKTYTQNSTKTFHYYANKFLSSLLDIRKPTYTTYKCRLRVFLQFLAKTKMDEKDVYLMTLERAERFLEFLRVERKCGGKTRNEYLMLMRRFFDFIKKDRLKYTNYFSQIDRVKEKSKITQYYTDHSIQCFKDYFIENDPQMWTVAQMLYYCFIRLTELRKIKISDLRLDQGFLYISADISKVNKERRPMIPPALLKYLKSLNLQNYPKNYYLISVLREPGPNQVSKNYMYERFKRARIALGISTDHILYAWKHTGMVKADNAGIPIRHIQNQAGHASLDMTYRYMQAMQAVESEPMRTRFPEI